MENLVLADSKARKGKSDQHGVVMHNKSRGCNIIALHNCLANKTYINSEYSTFTIFEPKERLIFRLPYYPDRIVHHAVMNILEPIFVQTFTADTYSCIKGKGIHAASYALRKSLKDISGTTYCLKIDIKKFYPNIDHDILKSLLRRKIKDHDLLWLLDLIIDSADGLPIGNYLSQYFANFYLTYFDHWIKEDLREKHYLRYADDMILLSSSKQHLHQRLNDMRIYLKDRLKLEVKSNYQIFPVQVRGIDFVGYKSFHTHTIIRKSIKKRFARMMVLRRNKASEASYLGWFKHCKSKNLTRKLIYERV